SFPVYVVVRGVPTALEVGVFAWLAAPTLIVYYLCHPGPYERAHPPPCLAHTGGYEPAHLLSALALTTLAALVALCAGGIGSFAAVWLVVVPVEAALSPSRRIVALPTGLALTAAGLLLLLGAGGYLPHAVTSPDQQSTLAALGIVSATLYAAGLALGAELLVRTGASLLHAEEDRHRLLAHSMTDVVIRHGRNGSVLSAPQAAESIVGVQASEL